MGELGAWWAARTRPYCSRDIWMAENRTLQLSEGSERRDMDCLGGWRRSLERQGESWLRERKHKGAWNDRDYKARSGHVLDSKKYGKSIINKAH